VSDMYFVLLMNPSNRVRFALVEEDGQSVMMFDNIWQAHEAANKTLFGAHGSYDIYDLHNVE
jgi:hypothetical protein